MEDSLRRYTQIMDQVHDPLICRDLDMTRWNEGAEKLYSCLTLKSQEARIVSLPSINPAIFRMK